MPLSRLLPPAFRLLLARHRQARMLLLLLIGLPLAQAFAAGADAIVVGRPIRQASDPRAAAEAIQQQILAAQQTA